MTLFQGPDGKTSMMRVLTFSIVIVSLSLWALANIKCWVTGCSWVAPDVQTVALILGALGAKALQNAVGEKTDALPVDKA